MAGALELRSDRCIVRHYRVGDAASLAENGNNRRIWLNLRDRFPHPYTADDAAAYIAFLSTQDDPTSYAIEVDGKTIGGIALHPREDIERIGAEIGYWIGEPYWGRGIATSAIRLLTQHALGERGLHRLFAIPMTTNVGSCRALEKAGYVLEGTMRRNIIKDGRIFDSHLYANVRE